MIAAQAAHISRLNGEVTELRRQVEEWRAKYHANREAAEFYIDLQKHVIENPLLQGEWNRFCSMLKLVGDEQYLARNRA